MKKIHITIIFILFFMLGFLFKYIFDFHLTAQPAEISQLTAPNNGKLTNIDNVIRAQENASANFITPDKNPNFIPIRDWSHPFIEIAAKSAIITDGNAEKILYQKNIFEKMPIASLTKLMTAIIIFENQNNLNEITTLSKTAILTEGTAGDFKIGDKISIENLIKSMLLESSNDAAMAIKEYFALKNIDLVALMNTKAEKLGLQNTRFSSVSGLEYENNYSTAYDLARLLSYSLKNTRLWNILNMPSAIITINSNNTERKIVNNNELLEKVPGMLGGKTGFTDEAKGCLATAVKINEKNKIITIVLGTDNRFEETEKLINWAKSAYRFN